MSYIPNLPIKLKALRLLRGMHQQELAAAARIHRYALVEIEQGRAYPSPEVLSAFERALGVKFDQGMNDAFAVLAPELDREREVASNGH